MNKQEAKWKQLLDGKDFDNLSYSEALHLSKVGTTFYRELWEIKANLPKMANYAKGIVENKLNIELPEIPVQLNGRLIATNGFYCYRGRTPLRIEISKPFAIALDDSDIMGVLIHEFCHYALHYLGKPFADGDQLFEQLLYDLDAPSNYYKSENEYRYLTHSTTRIRLKTSATGKRTWIKR